MKLVFFTTPNAALDGRKPIDALRSGMVEKDLVAAHRHGERGAM
jgi:hypothetical protein